MYTGHYRAIVQIARMAVRERSAYGAVVKAAEERADRKEQETGTRPDPQNSSNVKGQWARRSLVDTALAHCFTEERSRRYASVGYEGVNSYGEAFVAFIDAADDYFSGRGRPSHEERTTRFEKAIEAVIVDAKCEEALAEAHREAVLAGEEAPTADDAEWLAEYAKSQAAKANAMQEVADAARATAEAMAAEAQKQ